MRVAILVLAGLSLMLCCQDPTPPVTNLPDEFILELLDPVEVTRGNTLPTYVHYMPWFESPEFEEYGQDDKGGWGLHWTMSNQNPEVIDAEGKRQIASHFYPLIGPYDNGDDHYLEYAVACIKLAGFSGLFIDYPGTTPVNDWKLLHDHTNAIIPWLQKAGLEFAIVYEDDRLHLAESQGLISDPIDEVQSVFQYMTDNYFNHPNYVHYDDLPLVLNFGPQTLQSSSGWQEAADISDFNLVTLPYTIDNHNLGSVAAGEMAWVSTSLSDDYYAHCSQYYICVGSAFAEFRDFYEEGGWGSGFPDRDPLDGLLFEQTLQRAQSYSPPLLQIITWNDFGEGTMIEPTMEFEYERLEQIQQFLAVEYDKDDLALTVDLYRKRKAYSGDESIELKLDQVFYYLVSLRLEEARLLLNSIE